MKVLLAAASFSAKISGIQRHALNVVRCLLQHPEISAVQLVVAPWQQELASVALRPDPRLTIHVAPMRHSSLSRNLWYLRQLPKLSARLKPDLIYLSYPVPLNAPAFACPTVLALHDLYPWEIPGNFRFPHVLFNRLVLRRSLRSVDAIACVSDTTLHRMRQYTPPSVWRKAVRIYNCVEPEPLCSHDSPIPGWHGEPYFLCVAQHRRNKNIPLLIRAFHRLMVHGQIDARMKLVVVGIPGPETARIHHLVARRGLRRKVLFMDGLSDPELQWCYAHCETLAVPSETEGFGLPVAEGLLAGCRVICSDIPALREVGREHCRFFALGRREEESLAGELAASLSDPRGTPVPLPHLSIDVLASEYASLYRRLLPLGTPSGAEHNLAVYEETPERQSR